MHQVKIDCPFRANEAPKIISCYYLQILDQKVEVKAQSKIGSTANIKHKPGGGDKKVRCALLYYMYQQASL